MSYVDPPRWADAQFNEQAEIALQEFREERLVKVFLSGMGMTEVETREIRNHGDAPESGSFCGESSFGGRKADIVLHPSTGSRTHYLLGA